MCQMFNDFVHLDISLIASEFGKFQSRHCRVAHNLLKSPTTTDRSSGYANHAGSLARSYEKKCPAVFFFKY